MSRRNVVAYLRVSTSEQNLSNQRLEILEWAKREGVEVTEWVECEMSSRRGTKERLIDSLLEKLGNDDMLIVAELSRLGRSLGEVVQTVTALTENKVNLVTLKEGIRIRDGKQDLASKTMVAMFGLMADIERELLSERTKAGLARARSQGKTLGRPKGSTGRSKLDGREKEILKLMGLGVTKANIAKIVGVSAPTLSQFMASRKLGETAENGKRADKDRTASQR